MSQQPICLNLTNEEIETFETFKWWINDVTEWIIGMAGFFANILAIAILTWNNMSTIFNLLLACLAICDNFFILFSLMEGIENRSP